MTPPRTFALLVWLVAAGAVRAQATAADATGPARFELAPAAAESASGWGLGLKSWRVPPVATNGSISYDLRANRTQGESRSLSQLVTTNLGARSYIYQPWFATVSGELGLTTARSRLSASDPSQDPFAAQERATASERFFTGKARVDLFPRSRFPFEVHFDRSDSRIGAGTASALDFRTQNVGFSQRYRPVSGAYNLSAGFDRRQQWGTGFRDTQDALTADFSTRWKYNELSLGGAWNQSRRRATGEQSEFRTLVGRHNYAPNPDLSLNTTVNWSQTLDDVLAAPADMMVLQWSTVGLWHRDKSPLTLTGTARGLVLRDGRSDRPGMDSLGLTLGASYELNRNTRLVANGSAITSSSNGSGAHSFSGSVGANWQGDSMEFKGLRYDRQAGATAGATTSNSTGGNLPDGTGAARQTQSALNAQAGHSLSHSIPFNPRSALVLNASQMLSSSANRSSTDHGGAGAGDGSQSSHTLLHALAATWNIAADSRSAYARASYSDSAELGGGTARFQLWNFQLSGNFEIDRNRTLSGDLTWQRVEQRSGDALDVLGAPAAAQRTGSRNVGGEITYRQQRLFGIPRLRFSSRLKLAQDVLNQPGVLATIPDRETRLWENRLDWSVGRLETQVVFRISEVEGKRREHLMWRIQRNFGD